MEWQYFNQPEDLAELKESQHGRLFSTDVFFFSLFLLNAMKFEYFRMAFRRACCLEILTKDLDHGDAKLLPDLDGPSHVVAGIALLVGLCLWWAFWHFPDSLVVAYLY